MVPLARAANERLLEGKVLLAPEKKKVAHGRIVVGAVKHVSAAMRALLASVIGSAETTRRRHGAQDSSSLPTSRYDRIAGMAVARLGETRRRLEKRMAAEVARP